MKQGRFDVFLCYNSKDEAEVVELARALGGRGVQVWLDLWHLAPGSAIAHELFSGLERSAAVIVCVGAHGGGPWQIVELSEALHRTIASGETHKVIPVLLRGADREHLPPGLRGRHALALDRGVELAMQRIVRTLRGLPEAAGLGEDESIEPYRDLDYFRAEHAPWFFGRDAVTDELLHRVHRGDRLTVLVGASGSGKSSLLHAGLLHGLTDGQTSRQERWIVNLFSPGEDPYYQLARSVVERLAGDVGPVERARQVAEAEAFLLDHEDGLPRLLSASAPVHEDRRRDLLIVDRLEELWTYEQGRGHPSDEPARIPLVSSSFLRTLMRALDAPCGPFGLQLVLAVRADFFDRCLLDPHLGPRLSGDAQVNLPPPSRAELEEIIERPAARAGVRFEAGLVGRVADAVQDHAGGLPHLEHALAELWRRRDRARRLLTHESLEEIGHVTGAIARRAERVLAAFCAQEGEDGLLAMKAVFCRLVNVGDGGSFTRRRRRRSDLGGQRQQRAVDLLISSRLLVVERDAVEIVHEALISGWERLRTWLADQRGELALLQEVSDAASIWEAGGRSADDLWRGARLARAIEVFLSGPTTLPPLSEQERAFLEHSRKAVELSKSREIASARRVARLAATAAVTLAGLALVLGWMVRTSYQQVGISRGEQLVAAARQSVAEGDNTTAALILQEVQDPERVRGWGDEALRVLMGPIDRMEVPAEKIASGLPSLAAFDRSADGRVHRVLSSTPEGLATHEVSSRGLVPTTRFRMLPWAEVDDEYEQWWRQGSIGLDPELSELLPPFCRAMGALRALCQSVLVGWPNLPAELAAATGQSCGSNDGRVLLDFDDFGHFAISEDATTATWRDCDGRIHYVSGGLSAGAERTLRELPPSRWLDLSSNGQTLLLTELVEGRVQLWRVPPDRDPVLSASLFAPDSVSSAWIADDEQIAWGVNESSTYIWSLDTGEGSAIRQPRAILPGPVLALSVLKGGRIGIFQKKIESSVTLRDLYADSTVIGVIPPSLRVASRRRDDDEPGVRAVTLDAARSGVFLALRGGAVAAVDTFSGRWETLWARDDGVDATAVVVSDDGTTVAAAWADGVIEVRDRAPGAQALRVRDADGEPVDEVTITKLVFTHDGERLLAGLDSYVYWEKMRVYQASVVIGETDRARSTRSVPMENRVAEIGLTDDGSTALITLGDAVQVELDLARGAATTVGDGLPWFESKVPSSLVTISDMRRDQVLMVHRTTQFMGGRASRSPDQVPGWAWLRRWSGGLFWDVWRGLAVAAAITPEDGVALLDTGGRVRSVTPCRRTLDTSLSEHSLYLGTCGEGTVYTLPQELVNKGGGPNALRTLLSGSAYSFTPDGDQLIFITPDGTVRLLPATFEALGRELRSVTRLCLGAKDRVTTLGEEPAVALAAWMGCEERQGRHPSESGLKKVRRSLDLDGDPAPAAPSTSTPSITPDAEQRRRDRLERIRAARERRAREANGGSPAPSSP